MVRVLAGILAGTLAACAHGTTTPPEVPRPATRSAPPGTLRVLALGAVNSGCDPVDLAQGRLDATCNHTRFSLVVTGDKASYGCAPPTTVTGCESLFNALAVSGQSELAGPGPGEDDGRDGGEHVFRIVAIDRTDARHGDLQLFAGKVCRSSELVPSQEGGGLFAGPVVCVDADGDEIEAYFAAIRIERIAEE